MNTNSRFEKLDSNKLHNVNGGGPITLTFTVVGIIASANAIYNIGEGIVDGYRDAAARRS